jgi:hypothetical protein
MTFVLIRDMSKECKCEHWQQCPVCMPHRFDKNGHLLPPEPTPLQAARIRIEELEVERDQLRAKINVLREALSSAESALDESRDYPVTYDEVITALITTPEQSLAAYRNKVIEECAERIDFAELVGVLGNVTAHLIAAHSLLSSGGKKAVASDTIFKIMLQDYEKSFEAGRKALAKVRKP